MSLHAILEAIRASGSAQVREIEKRAYTRSNEILANSRLEAEEVKAEARTVAIAPAINERARIIQQARLEGLQIVGSVRKELVDSVLDQIYGRLAGIRSDRTYAQVLRRLIQESLTELAGPSGEVEKVQLQADAQDQALFESILLEMKLDLEISYELDCWGGLVAKSEDGRIVVINTLEERLERATPFLRRYLAALFENEQLESEASQVVESQFVWSR